MIHPAVMEAMYYMAQFGHVFGCVFVYFAARWLMRSGI